MAQFEIVKFGVVYNEGVRGMTGGAPQNDKVWVLARTPQGLVSFWGRRNGVLRSTTFKSAFHAIDKWEEKIGGRTSGDVYTAITNEKMRNTLFPNLNSAILAAI